MSRWSRSPLWGSGAAEDPILTAVTRLLAGGASDRGGHPRPRSGSRPLPYVTFPTAKRLRVVLPTHSPVRSSRAFRAFAHPTGRLERTAVAVSALAIGSGLPQWLGRIRPIVADGGGEVVHDYLREVFGGSDFDVVVRIGPPRPNRKPVLQAVSRSGAILGFVKVGWEPLTRQLVAHEARVLRELTAGGGVDGMRIPLPIASTSVEGLSILVVEALRPHRRRRSTVRRPPIGATESLAGLGDERATELVVSPYWQRVTERVSALHAGVHAPRGLRDALLQVEQRWGDVPLRFGMCHGDWTPANMARDGDRLLVWDWERSDPAAPVGMDAMHFLLYDARRSLASPRALDGVVASCEAHLRSWHLDERVPRLLLALDLLEMAVRFEEARFVGTSVSSRAHLNALGRVLAVPYGRP